VLDPRIALVVRCIGSVVVNGKGRSSARDKYVIVFDPRDGLKKGIDRDEYSLPAMG
jgi:hypothetical protein